MFVVKFVCFLSAILTVRGGDFPRANSRGVEYPTTRFGVWENLDPQAQNVAASMGYDATQWNSPGTFPLEFDRYDFLSDTSQDALEQLGIESEGWDCYVNHYRGYTWSEMEIQGMDLYYGSLGFNATRWEEETGFVSQIDRRLWNQLTPSEQAAAGELCYFEELWNGIQIRFWAQTQAPTFSPSALATNSPTRAPTLSPSSLLVTASPTAISTASPTAIPTASPAAIPTVSSFPTDIDPVDSVRYVPWKQLSDEFQVLAISLGYEMQSWDLPGSAQVESFDFASLEKGDRQTVNAMGLTEAQWNCYINHYKGFAWDELPDDTINNFETLGWDSALWESGETITRDQAWDFLSPSEQEAAIALCYRYETWEMINLEDWDPSASPSMAPNGTMSPAPSVIQGEPASLGPAASQGPTVASTAPDSAAPTAPSLSEVSLATIIIFWEGARQPIESRVFERSIVDYLTAFLVVAAPSPISSVDATAIIVEDRSALVSGQVTFEDNSSKVSQQDLEDLLIRHFSSTGTEALYKFLITSGFDIEGPLRVEVGGYDTSRPLPVQSSEEADEFPWLVAIVIAISVLGFAAAAVLIYTVRRKARSPDEQESTPEFESFRGSTTIYPSDRPSGKQEPDMDDYSIDQSLYTTDDSYLQSVR